MKMKTLPLLVVATVGTLALSGCVGTEAPEAKGGAGGDADSDATVLRLAYQYDETHPVGACGIPALNESLSGSGLQVEGYPAGQLGNEEESIQQVADGSLDLAIGGPSFLGLYEPKVAMLDAPYAFKDVDQFESVLDGEIGQGLWDSLRENGDLEVLGAWYYGTRHITSNNPVNTHEDLKGQKLRAANAPMYLTMAEIMGGTATPMALDEVYLALQQGTIDAQENPIPTIASQKFYEVQSYINLTGHMIQGVMLLGNASSIEALPAEQQEALHKAGEDAQAAVRECTEKQEAEFLEEWKADGEVTVNEDVDVDSFRERASEIVPKNFPEFADFYKQLQEG
jgi:tripartite ATP-independent transporter DctP family solute receptor